MKTDCMKSDVANSLETGWKRGPLLKEKRSKNVVLIFIYTLFQIYPLNTLK
jgi:hypothetical protein